MNFIKIDYRVIINTKIPFSWADLKYGIEKEYIGLFDVVKIAEHYYTEASKDDLVEKIALLLQEEYDEIITYFLTIKFKNHHELEISSRKWLYCYMFSLFNQKNNTENVFEIVENIYSNFDYPVEISGLIGYMPTDRTYKTKEEYTEEIMRKWESYLSTEKEILNKESSRLK